MSELAAYPARCRKNIRKLMHMLCLDAETVYDMMQMTALLMDLHTDDDAVAETVMMDNGLSFEKGDRA